jgi:hypothetical protein
VPPPFGLYLCLAALKFTLAPCQPPQAVGRSARLAASLHRWLQSLYMPGHASGSPTQHNLCSSPAAVEARLGSGLRTAPASCAMAAGGPGIADLDDQMLGEILGLVGRKHG